VCVVVCVSWDWSCSVLGFCRLNWACYSRTLGVKPYGSGEMVDVAHPLDGIFLNLRHFKLPRSGARIILRYSSSLGLAGMLFTDCYSVPPEISSEAVLVHFPLFSTLPHSIAYFPSRLSFGYSESYLYIIVLVMCRNGTMLIRSYGHIFSLNC
jgi:hypothetical protein